jgi:hypothetical protein
MAMDQQDTLQKLEAGKSKVRAPYSFPALFSHNACKKDTSK